MSDFQPIRSQGQPGTCSGRLRRGWGILWGRALYPQGLHSVQIISIIIELTGGCPAGVWTVGKLAGMREKPYTFGVRSVL